MTEQPHVFQWRRVWLVLLVICAVLVALTTFVIPYVVLFQVYGVVGETFSADVHTDTDAKLAMLDRVQVVTQVNRTVQAVSVIGLIICIIVYNIVPKVSSRHENGPSNS